MQIVDFRKLVDAVSEARCGLGPYYDECEAQAAAEDAALDLLAEEGFPFEEE